VTRETATVSPDALRHYRKQQEISIRELGRRVATRLEMEDGVRGLQVRLARIEQGDELSEQDRELVDALAAELAVGDGDLAVAPVYVWIKVSGGRPGIVELGMRMPAWSSPEQAFQGRDFLAHASKGHYKPFADAHLVPMRRQALVADVLDTNYPNLNDRERQLLVVLDPDPEHVLPYLVSLNEVMNADVPDESTMAMIVDTLIRFGLVGEVAQLHDLALRRLTIAPKDDPALVRAWRLRELRLNEILEIYNELRRGYRNEILAAVPTVE
jgi:hypothetical protein